MGIQVENQAALWFKRELDLSDGSAVRLYPRYSSGGGLHPGFSLGIAAERPVDPGMAEEVEGVTFFMEQRDLWYMEGFDLEIAYAEAEDDISYRYSPDSAQ